MPDPVGTALSPPTNHSTCIGHCASNCSAATCLIHWLLLVVVVVLMVMVVRGAVVVYWWLLLLLRLLLLLAVGLQGHIQPPLAANRHAVHRCHSARS